MVSQRARDRSKKRKAAVAGRLTQKSNPEIISALVYCLRRCFRAGDWTPFEPVNAHFKTLDRKRKDAVKCARWMLKIHANQAKGWYMLRHPEINLERFGLRWVDWSQMNPDLYIDKTIMAFDLEHQDLWQLVRSWLLGEDLDPIASGYTPIKATAHTESNPLASYLQPEIGEKLGDPFVSSVQAKATQPKPGPKTVIREVDGVRMKVPIEDKDPATEKQILGAGPRYWRGQQQW
jgi:hypothetical protein